MDASGGEEGVGEYATYFLTPSALVSLDCAAVSPGPRQGLIWRTSRKGSKMERRLWVSREGGGKGNSGDTVPSVEVKCGLSPNSPAAKKLDHRTIHKVLLL